MGRLHLSLLGIVAGQTWRYTEHAQEELQTQVDRLGIVNFSLVLRP